MNVLILVLKYSLGLGLETQCLGLSLGLGPLSVTLWQNTAAQCGNVPHTLTL